MLYKYKKNHYLLLEIMIAFTLMLCFTFPFIRKPYSLFNFEKKRLLKLEKERIADLSFAEILTKIYQNKVSSNDLNIKEKHNAQVFLLPDVSSLNKTLIKRQYQIIRKQQKNTQNKTVIKKLKITLTLKTNSTNDTFEHYLLVEDSKQH